MPTFLLCAEAKVAEGPESLKALAQSLSRVAAASCGPLEAGSRGGMRSSKGGARYFLVNTSPQQSGADQCRLSDISALWPAAGCGQAVGGEGSQALPVLQALSSTHADAFLLVELLPTLLRVGSASRDAAKRGSQISELFGYFGDLVV